MSYRSLFSVPKFARLITATTLARVGLRMWTVALVLFTLDRFHSPIITGLVVFLNIAPGTLISPIAGAFLDRHGRSFLITLDYVVSASMMTLIVTLDFFNALNVPLLLLIVGINTLTNPLSLSGSRTLIPVLTPREMWDRANATDSISMQMAGVIAPAIAGITIGLLGSRSGLIACIPPYVFAAFVLPHISNPIKTAATKSFFQDALSGIRYVKRHKTLRGLALSVSIGTVAMGSLTVCLPILVLLHLGGNASTVGWLWALLGVVAVISGFIAGQINTEGRERHLFALEFAMIGVCMILLATANSIWLVAIGMAAMGLATGPGDIGIFSLRQRRTHPAMFGRAMAVSMAINFAGFPIGAALAGFVAAVSLPAAFIVAALFGLLASILSELIIPHEHVEDETLLELA